MQPRRYGPVRRWLIDQAARFGLWCGRAANRIQNRIERWARR